jgi:hypothetical protein
MDINMKAKKYMLMLLLIIIASTVSCSNEKIDKNPIKPKDSVAEIKIDVMEMESYLFCQ